MYKTLTEVEDMFKYHPPTTEERIDKHNKLNAACLELAKVIYCVLSNEELRAKALETLQFTRMLVNQYITYEEISKDK